MISSTAKKAALAALLRAVASPALAQAVNGLAAAGLFSGIWSFILEGQRELTTAMTDAVSGLKSGNLFKASMTLGLVSFIYGVLHAVGPGHGKFIISAYALANEKTVRRGILLSFMAALIQALSAITIVGLMAVIFKATSIKIKATEAWLETLSWAIIAGLGAWLLWGQLRPLLTRRSLPAGAHARHDHGHHGHGHHGHNHGKHDHGQSHGSAGHVHTAACNHGHDHAHVHDEHCGHTHMATPEQLSGPWSWSHAWSLAFSIGIRPCTGAIGVLLFALAAGMFWAGVFATFAMAIGTAITVSVLASIAVGSRELAKRVSGFDTPAAARVQMAAGIAGSAMVMMMGLAFFFASLSNSGRL